MVCDKDLKLRCLRDTFSRFGLEENCPLVRRTRGVREISSSGGPPTSIFLEIPDSIKMRTNQVRILQQTYNLTSNNTIRSLYDARGDLGGILGKGVSQGEGDKGLLNLIGPQPTFELNYSIFEKAK